MKYLLHLVILAGLLVAGATAQSKTIKGGIADTQRVALENEPIDTDLQVIDMTGSQTFSGVWDVSNNLFRNNTFVTTGSKKNLSVNLSLSLDHTEPASDEDASQVTGGTWSVAVYRNGEYLGTLYGSVSEGTISTVMDRDTGVVIERSTQVMLLVTGGMDGFASNWNSYGPNASLKLVTDSSENYTCSKLEGLF